MRETKLRAWDKIHNRMVEVTAFFFIERSVAVRWNDTDDTRYNLSLDDCVLFEYTGLKDKNGKEIYEGNLLKVGERGTYEVKWRCGASSANYIPTSATKITVGLFASCVTPTNSTAMTP